MDGAPFTRRPRYGGPSLLQRDWIGFEVFEKFRVARCVMSGWVIFVTLEGEEVGVVRLAEPAGSTDDGIEHRLQLRGRATDDIKDLARGCLLLHRLGELPRPCLLRLEQPCVLDRDDGLVGEGGHEIDLALREWSNV